MCCRYCCCCCCFSSNQLDWVSESVCVCVAADLIHTYELARTAERPFHSLACEGEIHDSQVSLQNRWAASLSSSSSSSLWSLKERRQRQSSDLKHNNNNYTGTQFLASQIESWKLRTWIDTWNSAAFLRNITIVAVLRGCKKVNQQHRAEKNNIRQSQSAGLRQQ